MKAIAPGVWRMEGLIPYAINAYLVESPDGDILIDCSIRQLRRPFLRQLRNRKLGLVALTHCHPDHQGTAAAICRRFNVPLACHEKEVAVMEGREPMLPRNLILRVFGPLGAGPTHPVGRILREGDQVGEFTVVHTPGHTPGHVCYFRPRDRLLIAGDVLRNVVTSFEPGGLREPPHFFSADPLENRRSAGKLIELRPEQILFGHGMPCSDMRALEEVVSRLRG